MAEASDKLKKQGTILLCGKIDLENVKTASIDLLELDGKTDGDYDHISLILNSPGGGCREGFMLIDIIELCKMPVHITGLGICASMGLMILCSGTKGHRRVTKNTSLLCHQYSWSSEGKRHEIISDRKQQDILQQRFIDHLARHTKLNKKKVEKILLPESDVWLTTAEAIEYGIIDGVIA